MTNNEKDFQKSNTLKNRASKIIPHFTGTFSRSPKSFVEGVYPVYVQSAKGSHFTDVDGKNINISNGIILYSNIPI